MRLCLVPKVPRVSQGSQIYPLEKPPGPQVFPWKLPLDAPTVPLEAAPSTPTLKAPKASQGSQRVSLEAPPGSQGSPWRLPPKLPQIPGLPWRFVLEAIQARLSSHGPWTPLEALLGCGFGEFSVKIRGDQGRGVD